MTEISVIASHGAAQATHAVLLEVPAGQVDAASTEADVLSALSAASVALSAVSTDPAPYAQLSDAELVAASVTVGQERDALGAVGALLAGEIARRSAPEFGSRGLAQRNGFRTPIEMVKTTTRATGREAVQAVRTGTLLVETATEGSANPVTGEVIEVSEPWLKPLAVAIAAGQLSLSAVDSIRTGLGRPNSSATVELLTAAARQLALVAVTVDPDHLQRLARSARDEIDAAGIGSREEERRAARSLRLVTLPDGMGRLIWTMDPQTLAVVKGAYDRATSPRLGGVRFVGDDAQAKADEIAADPRTTVQLASDSFLHIVVAGSDADPSVLVGSGAPVVKLIATARTVERARAAKERLVDARERGVEPAPETLAAARAGFGFIEGHADPVSIGTIQHAICAGTTETIVFDEHGQPVELGKQGGVDSLGRSDDHHFNSENSDGTGPTEGRENRLFTSRQRSRLAARDGGCRWPGCSRPPSWSEAHHIEWWAKDHGHTVLENGVLLCRHHHLLLHNGGWDIELRRDDNGVDRYWLIPPADVDPQRTPRAMESNSPLWNHEFPAMG